MSIFTTARRVSGFDALEQAGDYYGPRPVIYQDGQRRQVLYLLPIHRGRDKFDYTASQGSGIHGATAPPWTFTEHPDGSLEIHPSIAAGADRYWHGYLRAGNRWETLDDSAVKP